MLHIGQGEQRRMTLIAKTLNDLHVDCENKFVRPIHKNDYNNCDENWTV